MKLQIAFDLIDLTTALALASEVQEFADILEVGSLLVYKHGDEAPRRFKEMFPQKTILVDMKIADRAKEAVTLCAQSGADWLTVLAGTSHQVIHMACTTAHEHGKKVMLDLLDASSLGQSALEAKSLGVDALLFHRPADIENNLILLDQWDMVYGNTQLPIFVAANVTRETVQELIAIQPAAIVISKSITEADNPRAEAAYYHSLISLSR